MGLPRKVVVDTLPFCNYIPRSFTSLTRNRNNLIAASRVDGSIDIYDGADYFYLVHHIPSWVLTSVYAICWSNKRLFAVGGEGRVFELDITSIHPKSSILLPGGLPARSLVSAGEILISGNDGGYINVIQIGDESFELKSYSAKVEGKVLCLAVDAEIKHIIAVGDSTGSIHIFDLKDGSTLSTYTIGREHSTNPTIAWSLIFVKGTLFSGDSRGNVNVWDTETGGLISNFRSHFADVLAFAVSHDNQSVFAAGADPIIHRFDYCETASTPQWQPSGTIEGSYRDVRGLIFVQNGELDGLRSWSSDTDYLIAAGNDARLQFLPCISSNLGDKAPIPRRKLEAECVALKTPFPITLPFWPLSVTCTLPLAAHFANSTFTSENNASARLCLMQHVDYMCLYRLPSKSKRLLRSNVSVRHIVKLAHIQPKHGNHIVSCCVSDCGKFVAYSDDVRARILKIEHPTSWNFNQDEPTPLVTISRLGWPGFGKNFQNRTPSTLFDGDNIDSDDSSPRLLFLDQSSADLFVKNETERGADFDEHLVCRKRKATASKTYNPSIEEDQTDEASALPPASLMAFTPSSNCLVCVDVHTQEIVCRRLDTGAEVWRLTIHKRKKSGPINLLKMTHLGKESGVSGPMTLLAVASVNERVSVYAFDETSSDPAPYHLFTCPRAAGTAHSGGQPRPLAIALCVSESKATTTEETKEEMEARVAILYTTGQLTEWILPLHVFRGSLQLGDTPQMDTWLEEFWKCHSTAWQHRMPRFHSLDYFFGDRIFLLGSPNFCLTVDRRKQLKPDDVHLAFRGRKRKTPNGCLRIFGQMRNMLQCVVLPDRVAAIRLEPRAATELPAPLKKKRFGT